MPEWHCAGGWHRHQDRLEALGFDGHPEGVAHDASRVHLNAIAPNLEMQVRAGGVTCRADEAETLATCIRKARSFLDRSGIDGELLIADNGSTDGSRDIAIANGALRGGLLLLALSGAADALDGSVAQASGALQGQTAPLQRWVNEERDLQADFARLFGDELPPGSAVPRITQVLIGADSDNTASRSSGWVADLNWVP